MNDNAIKDLVDSIQAEPVNTNKTYSAIVAEVDAEGVVWVNLAGSDKETPTASTSTEVKIGDVVNVEWRNNKLYIAGNYSNPAAGVTRVVYVAMQAEEAKGTAESASETADIAETKAVDAKETAESILIFDTSYVLSNRVALFQAHVYQGGVDIHTSFEPERFTWYLKNEEQDDKQYLGSGYTVSVNLADCGYGSEVIGIFTLNDDADALSSNGETYTTNNGDTITVRADGDYVKVRELTVSTTLYPTDKLMVIGAEDEHLVSVQTLQDYLDLNLDKQVLFDTTANWNSQITLVSKADTLYVYTDHHTDSDNNPVAGIKVGDGNAYVVDLPFIDAIAMEHIDNTVRHITNEERTFWNNKVRCYYTGVENLVFTTA